MADFTTEDIKKLGEALAKATKDAKTPAERRVATEDLIETKEGVKLTKLNNKQIKDMVKDNKALNEHQKEHIENLQKVNDRLSELGKKIRDGAEATIGFGKALYRGEGSISSFTDNFAGKFGVIGDTISGTGKLLDTNIEIFRQLSQTGANFGQSIVQLRTAAANAALPLDDFASLINENAQTLAALSGTATQGSNFIAGLGNALRTDAIPQLSTLGFTVEEINETLLLNLDRQRRFGTLDRSSQQFNIDSAIRFGKQLDSLAKLTGIQRDQLRANIESQNSNARLAAFLQNQTAATTDRLQSFAAVIQDIAPGLNEGFQDLIANAGVPVTEAALSVVQNIPEARGVIRDLISGVISTEQALVQIRNASTNSIDRFRNATVTGQVEFLNLQNDVINLGRRLVDVNAVLGPLGELAPDAADRLTTGLTQFEDASKRVGAATQSLETAALSFAGNLIGDASGGINTGLTGLSKVILNLPGGVAASLFGVSKLIQGGLNLLKDTGPTFAAVFAGTKAGIQASGLAGVGNAARGSFAGTMGGFGKGGTGLGSRALRIGGGIGAGIGALSAFGQLMDDDKTNNLAAILTLLGTGAGAIFGGPVGAALGGMAGGAIGSMIGSRQVGTSGATGQLTEPATSILQVEKGERVLSPTETAAVNNFSTEQLENKMSDMVNELSAANKTLANMVSGVNTLVGVESRALKAGETVARKIGGGGVGLV